MNVKAVMDEVAAKLNTITGLRVFAYPAAKLPLPGGIVGLPEEIEFDQTYGRGSDASTFPVWVMVGRADDRAAAAQLQPYLNGSGAKSVKAKLDNTTANTYTSCDTVTVTTATVGAFTYNGVDLLGAEFTVTVTGSGA
jgi:hypothetical protein